MMPTRVSHTHTILFCSHRLFFRLDFIHYPDAPLPARSQAKAAEAHSALQRRFASEPQTVVAELRQQRLAVEERRAQRQVCVCAHMNCDGRMGDSDSNLWVILFWPFFT